MKFLGSGQHQLWPNILAVCFISLSLTPPATAYDLKTFTDAVIDLIEGTLGIDLDGPDELDDVHQDPSVGFSCPALSPSPTVPDSVHKLRPGDINVVAAIGDSITAARGAGGRNVLCLLHDYRGLSWSVGGDEDVNTFQSIPNILKVYNPALYGYSSGKGDNRQRLNVAVSGATSRDIAEQARDLVNKMATDPNVDLANHWKLITIFIGGNDLCEACVDNITPTMYRDNIKETLDILQAGIPRAFVNLAQVLDVEAIRDVAKGLVCGAVQRTICPCMAYPESEEQYEEMIRYRIEYQNLTEELINSGVYDTEDDFTVVLQPFFRNTILPTTDNGDIDYSFFSADCFHLTKKGQNSMAIALWNNMMESVDNKSSGINFQTIEPVCPTEESPYLFTQVNSNASSQTGRPAAQKKKITMSEFESWAHSNIYVFLASFFALFIFTAFTVWFVLVKWKIPKRSDYEVRE